MGFTWGLPNYNLAHLVILAQEFGIDIKEMLPSLKGYGVTESHPPK